LLIKIYQKVQRQFSNCAQNHKCRYSVINLPEMPMPLKLRQAACAGLLGFVAMAQATADDHGSLFSGNPPDPRMQSLNQHWPDSRHAEAFPAGYGHGTRYGAPARAHLGDGHRDGQESIVYADVLQVRPRHRSVRMAAPHHCDAQPYGYAQGYQSSASYYNGTAGAVVGGVIGGALGAQVSRGSGRAVATAIGAVIGADVGRRHFGSHYREHDQYRQRRYGHSCDRQVQHYQQLQADGYDVYYRLHGRDYHAVLPYHPGDRLAVTLVVAPVR
jgi:uncharacterized protein YcfJ